MISSIRSNTALVGFGVGLAGIYAVALAIVARMGQLQNPDLIAGALTLDLTLLIPLLYYLLLARPRGWPAITVLPVFVVSVLIAGKLIPEARHQVLDIVSYGAVAAELALVALIAHKALRLRKGYREHAAGGADMYESLRASGRSVLGSFAGGVLAYEVAVFYYALAGWRRPAETDDRSFTVYRNSGYPTLLIAVMIAASVETVGVHLLVQLWSSTAAWIFTSLSIYTLFWLIGDYHALRLRPLQLTDDTLQFRLGLRWIAAVPLGSIRAIVDPTDAAPADKRHHLKAVLVGSPNRRIELAHPVRAIGFYGRSRDVATIDLQIDDPERFDAALPGVS